MNQSPEQRRARSDRFRLWMEQDGLAEAFALLKAEYIARIAQLDQTDSGFANKARILASAAKVVDVVKGQIETVIADGTIARDEIQRMERNKNLSAEQRRWL